MRCNKHVVTYRTSAPSASANGPAPLVHHCLLCDAVLAIEPAPAPGEDALAPGTALFPYEEAVALGFGYPEDLPEPEPAGGCGCASSGGGCGSGAAARKRSSGSDPGSRT